MEKPLDDLTYDWITILQAKANGLNAYEKYLKDAREANSEECISLLEQLKNEDADMVERVRSHVAEILQNDGAGGQSRQRNKGSSSSERVQ